jgi:hypothetical protein
MGRSSIASPVLAGIGELEQRAFILSLQRQFRCNDDGAAERRSRHAHGGTRVRPDLFAKESDNQAGSAIDYMWRTVETGRRENKSIDPQPRDDPVKIANRPPHTAEN